MSRISVILIKLFIIILKMFLLPILALIIDSTRRLGWVWIKISPEVIGTEAWWLIPIMKATTSIKWSSSSICWSSWFRVGMMILSCWIWRVFEWVSWDDCAIFSWFRIYYSHSPTDWWFKQKRASLGRLVLDVILLIEVSSIQIIFYSCAITQSKNWRRSYICFESVFIVTFHFFQITVLFTRVPIYHFLGHLID